MNKARRHELKMLKYKKRLKNYQLKEGEGNFYSFRSHGKPCSCFICSHSKYDRNNPNFKKGGVIETDFTHKMVRLSA